LEDLIPIVQKYGKENNYSIIFEKADRVLLYASDALDITDKIIAIYDAQYKKGKK
jgi:Skp family chaperone for outer membrane proteins